MISMDKLTVKSQEALQDAVRMASERGHSQVEGGAPVLRPASAGGRRGG